MGGSNDPSNLIKLSVSDHADAHKLLYEQHGAIEDKIAWLSLSGQITHKEAVHEGKKIGRHNANIKLKEIYGDDWRYHISKLGVNKVQEILKEDPTYLSQRNTKSFKNKHHTEESKRKIGAKNSILQRGVGNSQYGTRWIYSLIEKQSKKIKKSDPLPVNWFEGRKIKF